jgi:hypothetical protein
MDKGRSWGNLKERGLFEDVSTDGNNVNMDLEA